MATYYRDRIDCDFHGARLIIFRREDSNDNFWFRASIDGKRGYVRRSTGTADADEAMRIAREAYDDLRIRQKSGLEIIEITFDKFFIDWIERRKRLNTEQRYQWKKNTYHRYLREYFGSKVLSKIDKRFVDGYWDYRLNYWNDEKNKKRIAANDRRIGAKSKSSFNIAKSPAFGSLKMEASLINEILRGANDDGYLIRQIKISAQDAVAKHKRGDNWRQTFNRDEMRVLRTNLFNYAENRGKWKGNRVHSLHLFQRKMLHTYVQVAISTGMRVGEIYQMRWKDVKTELNDKGEQIIVIEVRRDTSKTYRERQAVAYNDHTTKVINDYKELCIDSGYSVDGEDLVFFSIIKGERRIVDLSVSFKTFLMKCEYQNREGGLRYAHDGSARTLYSLRHYYATDRLTEGKMDVGQLAYLMGTGVNQIRNHYGRHIRGEAFINQATRYESRSASHRKSQSVQQLMKMVEIGLVNEEEALEAFKRVVDNKYQAKISS